MDYTFFYYLLSMTFSACLAIFVTIACMDIRTPQPQEKKIIIKTVNQVAKMLADIFEGQEEASDEDKDYLFHLLVCTMAEDNHPDFYEFNYIGRKILAGEQTNVAWDTWFVIALRRLAKDTSAVLPEAWFLEINKDVVVTEPQPTPILAPLEKEDIDELCGSADELPEMSLPPVSAVAEEEEKEKEETVEEVPPTNELDQSISSESVVSESDSDDSQQLVTEAGPMASPAATQTEEAQQIFSEKTEDVSANYQPVNKYLELATGEERDLTAVD